jgi:NADPH:quinone reductase-like Zn-dependent oxidoreductase
MCNPSENEIHPNLRRFGILGGGENPPIGTFASHVIVERDQVIPTPAHLEDVHAAAWPLGGVTAWRCVLHFEHRDVYSPAERF